MAANPKTIDEYLAAVSPAERAALEKLRKTIRASAPEAEECISYQLPAFRQDGMLVAFGATAVHCSFYLMSSTTVAAHAAELARYATSKGTIHFRPDEPLPTALVIKLVKARLAENAARRGKPKAPSKATAKRVAKAPRDAESKPDAKASRKVESRGARKADAKATRKVAAKGGAKTTRKVGTSRGGSREVSLPGAPVRGGRGGRASSRSASQTDSAVDAFFSVLDHPLKPALEALRSLILVVSPDVREGIKWNAPSFRTSDWFATTNVHGKNGLRVILHTGAKVKASATKGLKIADPTGLLEWLAKDRCLVTLGDAQDVQAKGPALKAILREWIRQL